MLDAVSHFFGTDRVRWTITTSKSAVPQLVQTERTYTRMNALGRQIEDARIWAGLHFRRSMQDGERLGHRVTRHVTRDFFQPLRRW